MQLGAINFHDLSHSKFKDGLFERANSLKISLEHHLWKFEFCVKMNPWSLSIADYSVSLERQYFLQQGTNKPTCWQIHLF